MAGPGPKRTSTHSWQRSGRSQPSPLAKAAKLYFPSAPTTFLHGQDPTETWAAQDFRSAKALFVPSLKRDIVPSIACTQPPAGGVAWQSISDGENSYSHWA